ncbi:hypothetical protein COY95_00740, partial [Candidatus Woesearchaeota archaeon CG_4_10_14_0_8_um_filter_47_5]
NKKHTTEVETSVAEIQDLKQDFAGFKEKMQLIIKELQTRAKKEDVQVLEKYVNLWEPMNFVTHTDVEKIVAKVLEEELAKVLARAHGGKPHGSQHASHDDYPILQ